MPNATSNSPPPRSRLARVVVAITVAVGLLCNLPFTPFGRDLAPGNQVAMDAASRATDVASLAAALPPGPGGLTISGLNRIGDAPDETPIAASMPLTSAASSNGALSTADENTQIQLGADRAYREGLAQVNIARLTSWSPTPTPGSTQPFYDPVTGFSACTAVCGTGIRERFRRCIAVDGTYAPMRNCGVDIPGDVERQEIPCTTACSFQYGAWGGCTGGSGQWWQSGFGACNASSWWSTDSFGGCHPDNGYCGDGLQYRNVWCSQQWGQQYQGVGCSPDANSGAQYRPHQCVNDRGEVISDGYCGVPASTQACTPGPEICNPATRPAEVQGCLNSCAGAAPTNVQACSTSCAAVEVDPAPFCPNDHDTGCAGGYNWSKEGMGQNAVTAICNGYGYAYPIYYSIQRTKSEHAIRDAWDWNGSGWSYRAFTGCQWCNKIDRVWCAPIPSATVTFECQAAPFHGTFYYSWQRTTYVGAPQGIHGSSCIDNRYRTTPTSDEYGFEYNIVECAIVKTWDMAPATLPNAMIGEDAGSWTCTGWNQWNGAPLPPGPVEVPGPT